MCNPFRAPCMTHFLARILMRRPCGDPSGIFAQEVLAGSCTDSYQKILWISWCTACMVLYRSLWEDLVKILLKSSKRSLHDLVQVPVKGSCGDPSEILSCMILYGPFLADPDGVLVKSSRCPGMVKRSSGDIVQIFPERSLRWDLEDALR